MVDQLQCQLEIDCYQDPYTSHDKRVSLWSQHPASRVTANKIFPDESGKTESRWRPSCKRSLICPTFRGEWMFLSAQIWQGASCKIYVLKSFSHKRYFTNDIAYILSGKVTFLTIPHDHCPLSSHPDKLTERELIDVTTVFHAFESGVRSGTMHHEWLKEVSKVLDFASFFPPPGDEHAWTEPQRAGSDWHPKPCCQAKYHLHQHYLIWACLFVTST